MCINPDNGEFYYNWYAVNDPRGLAPEGFHVPSDDEWHTLTKTLGGDDVAGKLMKSPKKWDGSGPKGFNAIPSGYRDEIGYFHLQDSYGYWWSSSPSASGAWSRTLSSCSSIVHRNNHIRQHGFSVRCIKTQVK
jgi:uncharacterized protein (TIGR02145 family)